MYLYMSAWKLTANTDLSSADGKLAAVLSLIRQIK